MPKLKNYGPGRRVNVWIPEKQDKVAVQIENLSNFLQICLDNAADIMAWAILREVDPKKYDTGRELDKVVDQFNQKYPLDPLTKKRIGSGSRVIAPNPPDNKEQNPALH